MLITLLKLDGGVVETMYLVFQCAKTSSSGLVFIITFRYEELMARRELLSHICCISARPVNGHLVALDKFCAVSVLELLYYFNPY